MYFFSGIRASFHYGKAMGDFYKGRYEKAARLLEKVRKLDPEDGDFFCYLGQCYLAMEQFEKGMELLSRTYESLCNKGYSPESSYEKQDYVTFLHAFATVLRHFGQEGRAVEIAGVAEETRMRMGGR